jgi:hypothetical protein
MIAFIDIHQTRKEPGAEDRLRIEYHIGGSRGQKQQGHSGEQGYRKAA